MDLTTGVEYILLAFWFLCTAAAAVTALELPVPSAFRDAVRLSAARGKTWHTRPKALGFLRVRYYCLEFDLEHLRLVLPEPGQQVTSPTSKARVQDWSVPQEWFWHFYFVGTLVTAATAVVQLLQLAATVTFEASAVRFADPKIPSERPYGAFCGVSTALLVTVLLQMHLYEDFWRPLA